MLHSWSCHTSLDCLSRELQAAFSHFTTDVLQRAVAARSPGDGEHAPLCRVLYEQGGTNGAWPEELGFEYRMRPEVDVDRALQAFLSCNVLCYNSFEI